MFPLSASNQPDVGHKTESKVDALTFIKNELRELYFVRIQRLREYKSRVKEQGERDASECVKMVSAELVATTVKELLWVSKRIQDSRRAIDLIKNMIELAKATSDVIEKEEEEIVTIAEVEKSNEEEEFVTIAEVDNSRRATREVIETNDIIEEKEQEFATIAEVVNSNKVAKVANNHIIPAGGDVVAKHKKQDKKKSCAAKFGEELESIEKKKHELKSFEKKENETTMRIEAKMEIIEKNDNELESIEKNDKELELQEISVSENTMPAGDYDLTTTLEWDTESDEDDVDHDSDECIDPVDSIEKKEQDFERIDNDEADDVDHDSDECLDHVDSIEKKEQDLERIDDDESTFSIWNKKMLGFALL